MKQINAFRAYLTLCILAVASLFGGVNAVAQETVYKTLLFGSSYNSKGISSYTDSWTSTVDGFVWDIANFNNNNNGWSYVKCGRSSVASVATITTQETIDQPITKVVVVVDAYTSGRVTNNKAILTVASDAAFTQDVENVEVTLAKGNVTHTITNPQANRYYKLTYNCPKASKNGGLQISKVEYYYEAGPVLPTPELSFNASSYSMNVGGALTVSATTTSDAAITYSSSDPEVAAVEATTGAVIAKKEGKVIITANVAATETYAAASATCELTVVDPNKPAEVVTPMSFKEVTSADQLIEGGQYIIVCKGQKMAMTTINKKGSSVAIEIDEDGSIKSVPNEVTVYTMSTALVNNEGSYNFVDADGKKLGITSATGTDITISATSTKDTKFDWVLDSSKRLVCKANTDGKRALLFNGSQFGHYATSNLGSSGYYTVQLYRLEANASIYGKIGYTTYYTDKKYKLADGLTAYAITEAPVAGAVTMTKAYEAGQEVPANTALLLEGAAGAYGMPVLNKEVPAYEGDNMLEGRRNSENVTESTRENVLYYKLTLKDEVPGFYWGADNGAPFLMKNPNTAYLAVPASMASAAGFRIIMDGTTGIDTVTTPTQAGNAIYTLAGVRVNAQSTKSLPKGIYIVNGKKMLVK